MCYGGNSISSRKEPSEMFLENCISDIKHLVLCWHFAKISSFHSGARCLHAGSVGSDHTAASSTPAFFSVMLYF